MHVSRRLTTSTRRQRHAAVQSILAGRTGHTTPASSTRFTKASVAHSYALAKSTMPNDCDHIVGLYESHSLDCWLVRAGSEMATEDLAEPFNFCPLCGAQLVHTPSQHE